jgi:hypothetical protein
MMTKKRTIIMSDGKKYYSDRPHDCWNCFFWKNRKAGCVLGKDNCYYLAGIVKSEQEKKCENCPYAKGQPCVTGSCFKDLGNWLRERRESAKNRLTEREGAANV